MNRSAILFSVAALMLCAACSKQQSTVPNNAPADNTTAPAAPDNTTPGGAPNSTAPNDVGPAPGTTTTTPDTNQTPNSGTTTPNNTSSPPR